MVGVGLWGDQRKGVLFHGSRGGIRGAIRPVSRPGTDFGTGFYMGTDVLQAKSLIAYDALPMAYTLSVDITQVPGEKILYLNGYDWVFTILHHRQNCAPFNGSALDEYYGELCQGVDWIIGPIADDRMSDAVRLFSEGAFTDTQLFDCLSHVQYGVQACAKTETACECIDVISEQPIHGEEADSIRQYAARQFEEARAVFAQVQQEQNPQGKRIQELLASPPPRTHHSEDHEVIVFSDIHAGTVEDALAQAVEDKAKGRQADVPQQLGSRRGYKSSHRAK